MIYRFLNGLVFLLASTMVLVACAILFAPPIGTGDSKAGTGGSRAGSGDSSGTATAKEETEPAVQLTAGMDFGSQLEMTLFVRRPGSQEYEQIGSTPGALKFPECDDYYFRLDGLIPANSAQFAREVQAWSIEKIRSPGEVTSIRLPAKANDATLKVFVRDIPELREVALFKCHDIHDLAMLTERPELTNLELSDCQGITDLAPLAQLKNLMVLNMPNCDGPTDFSSLAGLTNLTHLNLRGCDGLADLTPLAGLTNLTQLELSSCDQVADLKPLAGLKHLTSLKLEECGITDLSPLAGLSELKSLSLYGCTKLNAAQVEQLQKQLPGCQIAF